MARIRTIKPEFPQSESVGKLSRDARLLFLQLFTIVDDAGRARGASRMLASLLYPYDGDISGMVELWLIELEENGRIRRYQVGGSTYLEIANWLEHQKIDHPSKSRLPGPGQPIANSREDSRSLAPDLNQDLNLGPRIKGPETLGSPRENPQEENRAIDVKRVKFPKHGTTCERNGVRLVYFKRGTMEFDAYSQDFKDVKGELPEATSDGRWFKALGEQFLKVG